MVQNPLGWVEIDEIWPILGNLGQVHGASAALDRDQWTAQDSRGRGTGSDVSPLNRSVRGLATKPSSLYLREHPIKKVIKQ